MSILSEDHRKSFALASKCREICERLSDDDAFLAWSWSSTQRREQLIVDRSQPTGLIQGRPDLRVGSDLTFGNNLEKAFSIGWHASEPWGTWSSSKHATLHLNVGYMPSRILIIGLLLSCLGHAPMDHECIITCKGKILATVESLNLNIGEEVSVEIDPSDVSSNGDLDLKIEVRKLFSVASTVDQRELGVALLRIRLRGDREVDKEVPVLHLDETVTLGAKLDSMLTSGWHIPDGSFVWSAGENARLLFKIADTNPGIYRLDFGIIGVSKGVPDQTVSIYVNGHLAVKRILQGPFPEVVSVWLESSSLNSARIVDIMVRTSDMVVPVDYNVSDDIRSIGVALSSISAHREDSVDDVIFPLLSPNVPLDLSNGLGRALVEGWSYKESWGVWSNSLSSTLVFRIQESDVKYEIVRLELMVFVPHGRTLQMKLSCGSRSFHEIKFFESAAVLHVDFPTSALSVDQNGLVSLVISLSGLFSPSEISSHDARSLGVGLRSLIRL